MTGDVTKFYYDIESLRDVFSLVGMTDNGKVYVLFYGSTTHSDVTEEQLRSVVMDRLNKTPHGRRCVGDNPRIYVECVRDDMTALTRLTSDAITGVGTFIDEPSMEWRGWNSRRYDLVMLCAIRVALNTQPFVTTQLIRNINDAIISFDGPPWRQLEHIAQRTALNAQSLKERLNMALYTNRHIDITLLDGIASNDGFDLAPALKREIAKTDADIVMDEHLSSSRDLTHDEVLDLIAYNVNDVIGTMLIGQHPSVALRLANVDGLRELFPYIGPSSIPPAKIGKWSPPERDESLPQLAGRIINGPKRQRPTDNRSVDYIFPLPSGSQDLLEFINEHETLHPDLYTFFAHFRGKDTRERADLSKVIASQPVTHSATMRCPYFGPDGRPLDCSIVVSTGGAHGDVVAGLHTLTDDEVSSWIRGVNHKTLSYPTVDVTDIVHLDWSSFYPTMAAKLKMYDIGGRDVYSEIIERRLTLKSQLPADRSSWTDDDHKLNREQDLLKLVLNSATGASNMHSKFAKLPLDNRTLSMRLIGNMLIWALAQRLATMGGLIMSTNTDGIYVANLDIDTVARIAKEYVADYGMDVEPERIERFVNRDTSNRIEWDNGARVSVRGELARGAFLEHSKGRAVRGPVKYPLVAAHAAIMYMDDPDWLTVPYDRARMEQIIQTLFEQSTTPAAWYHIYAGSSARRLTLDGVPQQRICRVVFTTDGQHIAQQTKKKLNPKTIDAINWAMSDGRTTFTDAVAQLGLYVDRQNTSHAIVSTGSGFAEVLDDGSLRDVAIWGNGKPTGYSSDTGVTLNTYDELTRFDMTTLDLTAYADWAQALLKTWKVTADVPAVNMRAIDEPVLSPKRVKVTNKLLAQHKLFTLYGLDRDIRDIPDILTTVRHTRQGDTQC